MTFSALASLWTFFFPAPRAGPQGLSPVCSEETLNFCWQCSPKDFGHFLWQLRPSPPPLPHSQGRAVLAQTLLVFIFRVPFEQREWLILGKAGFWAWVGVGVGASRTWEFCPLKSQESEPAGLAVEHSEQL